MIDSFHCVGADAKGPLEQVSGIGQYNDPAEHKHACQCSTVNTEASIASLNDWPDQVPPQNQAQLGLRRYNAQMKSNWSAAVRAALAARQSKVAPLLFACRLDEALHALRALGLNCGASLW